MVTILNTSMTIDYRSGNDGTNENVHNFFINIFARGGAIHLILYLLFFGITYQQAAKKKGNKRIYLMVFVPLIFTSFLMHQWKMLTTQFLFYFFKWKNS